MYTLKPITERVRQMRTKYRDTKPEFCTSRYRLITEFYMNNPDMTGILKRAKNFKNICEHIAIRIDEGEVIVGAQSVEIPRLRPLSGELRHLAEGRAGERVYDDPRYRPLYRLR